jgi:hypothetical protein
VRDDLERLSQASAFAGCQGHRVVLSLVRERRLAPPHLAADLDDLARAAQGIVVGDAVETLDDLGARRAETEVESAIGERVDAGGGHGDQCGSPRVDRQDRRADLHRLGQGGKVAHERGTVETVRLGHPDQVETDFFHLHDVARGLFEASRVVEHRRNLHRDLPIF